MILCSSGLKNGSSDIKRCCRNIYSIKYYRRASVHSFLLSRALQTFNDLSGNEKQSHRLADLSGRLFFSDSLCLDVNYWADFSEGVVSAGHRLITNKLGPGEQAVLRCTSKPAICADSIFYVSRVAARCCIHLKVLSKTSRSFPTV